MGIGNDKMLALYADWRPYEQSYDQPYNCSNYPKPRSRTGDAPALHRPPLTALALRCIGTGNSVLRRHSACTMQRRSQRLNIDQQETAAASLITTSAVQACSDAPQQAVKQTLSVQQHGFLSLNSEVCRIFNMIEGIEDAPGYGIVEHHEPMLPNLRLRLACKLFKALYDEQAQRLVVGVEVDITRLPGLLSWLHKSQVSTRVLQATCDKPILDSVLSGLAVLNAPLTCVSIMEFDEATFVLLSAFRTLAKIWLSPSDEKVQWDLSALQSLPYLTDLYLEGEFLGLHMLKHLTYLSLNYASVTHLAECSFLSALRTLLISGSTLDGFDPDSLPICTSLQVLTLSESIISDTQGSQLLTKDFSVVPAHMYRLTDLVTLNLQSRDAGELGWVGELTTLRNLHIQHFGCPCLNNFLTVVTSLTRLTRLSLHNEPLWSQYERSSHKKPCPLLYSNCQWHQLSLLRELVLLNFTLYLSQSSAVSLLKLEHLTYLSLGGVKEDCGESWAVSAALFYSLAAKRPHVKVLVEGHSLLQYLHNDAR